MLLKNPKRAGEILLLPDLRGRAEFLTELLAEVLPSMRPDLFPELEGARWVEQPNYQLAAVKELQQQIREIEENSQRQILELSKKIDSERESTTYLFDLVRETGKPLVDAVVKSLQILGFQKIIDVDEEARRIGEDKSLLEDLRIEDQSPIPVIDVKGVAGKPADAEALQAQKHTLIRIQRLRRADVKGVSIINHQRHIEPLARVNDMPFRREILDNAEPTGLCLLVLIPENVPAG